MLNIVIADSHQLYREAVSGLLKRTFTECHLTEVSSYEELQNTITAVRRPELVLMDLDLPGLKGFSGQTTLKRRYPEIQLITKYHCQEPVVAAQTYECGAAAFVSNGILPERLVWVVRAVMEGQMPINELGLHNGENERTVSRQVMREQERLIERVNQLNLRQIQVLVRLTEGKLNKQIAADLNISLSSVKAHMKVILRVLDVRTRTHAALIARKLLLVRRQLENASNPIILPPGLLFEQAAQRSN